MKRSLKAKYHTMIAILFGIIVLEAIWAVRAFWPKFS